MQGLIPVVKCLSSTVTLIVCNKPHCPCVLSLKLHLPSVLGMTKVKVGKEDSSSAEFLEKRRAALERYRPQQLSPRA